MPARDGTGRRGFLRALGLGAGALAAAGLIPGAGPRVAHAKDGRPNILFAIADDWSWPHANMPLGEVKVTSIATSRNGLA